jgi:hypothetical protein
MKLHTLLPAAALAFAAGAAQLEAQVAPNCENATFGAYSFQNCWIASQQAALPQGTDWGQNNPSRQELIAEFLDANEVGGATWAPLAKVDAGQSGRFNFTGANTGFGVINFTPALDAGWFALSFKQGNNYALYTFNESADVSSMQFNISGIGSGWSGVSHIALWRGALCGDDCLPDPSIVPEPASLTLLIGGLFGLGATARRRRRTD